MVRKILKLGLSDKPLTDYLSEKRKDGTLSDDETLAPMYTGPHMHAYLPDIVDAFSISLMRVHSPLFLARLEQIINDGCIGLVSYTKNPKIEYGIGIPVKKIKLSNSLSIKTGTLQGAEWQRSTCFCRVNK